MKRKVFALLSLFALVVALPVFADDRHFGAPFTDAKMVTLKEAIENVEQMAGKVVKIEGEIRDVCQAKGCWLVVSDGEREMRVSFKDYGFFVPKDTVGKKVVLEGVVEKKVISEMHAQHIASESRSKKVDPKSIKGPQEIITMVANGVSISD